MGSIPVEITTVFYMPLFMPPFLGNKQGFFIFMLRTLLLFLFHC